MNIMTMKNLNQKALRHSEFTYIIELIISIKMKKELHDQNYDFTPINPKARTEYDQHFFEVLYYYFAMDDYNF